MRTLIALVAVLSTPVFAADASMICVNPRQEYLAELHLSDQTVVRTFASGIDVMKFAIIDTPNVVDGPAVGEHPAFHAVFSGPQPRIEFVDGGKVFQTDNCRYTNTPTDIGMGK